MTGRRNLPVHELGANGKREPFRSFPTTPNLGRRSQWDVAMGLAMKELN